jgi:hypothetical protein
VDQACVRRPNSAVIAAHRPGNDHAGVHLILHTLRGYSIQRGQILRKLRSCVDAPGTRRGPEGRSESGRSQQISATRFRDSATATSIAIRTNGNPRTYPTLYKSAQP